MRLFGKQKKQTPPTGGVVGKLVNFYYKLGKIVKNELLDKDELLELIALSHGRDLAKTYIKPSPPSFSGRLVFSTISTLFFFGLLEFSWMSYNGQVPQVLYCGRQGCSHTVEHFGDKSVGCAVISSGTALIILPSMIYSYYELAKLSFENTLEFANNVYEQILGFKIEN